MTLATFAAIVDDVLRSSDSFGRWGGEEFLAVLPETDQQAAFETAERIRTAVAAYRFPAIADGGHLTCSIGVAICPDDTSDFTSLVELADEATYAAKDRGRNQTATARSGRLRGAAQRAPGTARCAAAAA